MQNIKVMDKFGKFNTWTITFEDEKVYEVFCRGYETVLYKSKCFYYDNELHSSEIRSMNLEDSANQSTGTEECSVCGRLVTNYNRLYVVVDTDNYVCKACAKFAKSKVKSAKIV